MSVASQATAKPETKFVVTPEDRVRMTCLLEEIQGRLKEFGLIFRRVTSKPGSDVTGIFIGKPPQSLPEHARAKERTVSFGNFTSIYVDGQYTGYWDDDEGVCVADSHTWPGPE